VLLQSINEKQATTNMVLLIRLVEVSTMAKNANKKPAADAGKKPAQKPAK